MQEEKYACYEMMETQSYVLCHNFHITSSVKV